MKKLFLTVFLAFCGSVHATTWYVDNTATGANNGTSWTDAWSSLSAITGLSAGDVVYISGGPTGSSQTYSQDDWVPAGGTSGNPITYQTGQDSSHDGMVILAASTDHAINLNNSYVTLSGQVGSGISGNAGPLYTTQILDACHMEIENSTQYACIYSGANITNVHLCYLYFPGSVGGIYFADDINNIELDHCYIYKGAENPDIGNDIALYMGGMSDATGFDQIKIHDNYFQVVSD
jgi:hypothetical protein